MTTQNIKRIKISEFIKSYFSGELKPCNKTIQNHIQSGRLSGQKIGGNWFVIVTAWGEPLHYGDPPQSNSLKINATGNAIADRILKRMAA